MDHQHGASELAIHGFVWFGAALHHHRHRHADSANVLAVPATVSESIQFASIPLFQFAIFYNMNLEIAAAQTLTIVGPVWSNAGIWSGSTTVTFAEYGFRRRNSHQLRQ